MLIEGDKNGNKTVTDKSWRLIYNGSNLIMLEYQECKLQSGGDTQIFVADTKEECLAELDRLNLFVPDYLKDKV